VLSSFTFVADVKAQDKCVSQERIGILVHEIKDTNSFQPNVQLKSEILSLKNDLVAQTAKALTQQSSGSTQVNVADSKISTRICQILNNGPWPGKSTVDTEAASAWLKLIKTYLSAALQRDLLPVVAAGVDNGEIPKDDEMASFIDRLRLRLGLTQLFGSQLAEQNGFLVLFPLQSETNVDAWRKEYGMEPLAAHLRVIENFYHKLVIRSTAKVRKVAVSLRTTLPDSQARSAPVTLDADSDVVKVNTSIVTIDATVIGKNVPSLGEHDFRVYEDGEEQDVTSFSASEAPFDIVLLLDLSGSTANKIGLVKKTTKHFIETKRDVDRVAIIIFNSTQTVVSSLEASKVKLLDSLSKIKGMGASKIWDSEKFAMDLLMRDSPAGRRKAIVVMTDGIDNDLFFQLGFGSDILFGDLVEEIRNNQISIFPIYLNPAGPGGNVAGVNDLARRTMQLLADESGGTFYTTANLDSLDGVYERVLQDVGRVFSLGYQPKNDKHDGIWRTIKIEVPSHPELKVRARTGYYAK
jgi:VWFA-related protein